MNPFVNEINKSLERLVASVLELETTFANNPPNPELALSTARWLDEQAKKFKQASENYTKKICGAKA